jgi:hypothetical protein
VRFELRDLELFVAAVDLGGLGRVTDGHFRSAPRAGRVRR